MTQGRLALVLVGLAGWAAVALVACDRTPYADVDRGSDLYARYCFQCHDSGDGIGSRLSPAVLSSYGTAAGLFEYNRKFMPYAGEGSLATEDYWDITAYMLVQHGFAAPELQLAPAGAPDIQLRR